MILRFFSTTFLFALVGSLIPGIAAAGFLIDVLDRPHVSAWVVFFLPTALIIARTALLCAQHGLRLLCGRIVATPGFSGMLPAASVLVRSHLLATSEIHNHSPIHLRIFWHRACITEHSDTIYGHSPTAAGTDPFPIPAPAVRALFSCVRARLGFWPAVALFVHGATLPLPALTHHDTLAMIRMAQTRAAGDTPVGLLIPAA